MTNPLVVTRAQGILVCWIQGPSWGPSKCHCSPKSRLQHVWLNYRNRITDRNSWHTQHSSIFVFRRDTYLKNRGECVMLFSCRTLLLSLWRTSILSFCSSAPTISPSSSNLTKRSSQQHTKLVLIMGKVNFGTTYMHNSYVYTFGPV